jgi:hypothetical protein
MFWAEIESENNDLSRGHTSKIRSTHLHQIVPFTESRPPQIAPFKNCASLQRIRSDCFNYKKSPVNSTNAYPPFWCCWQVQVKVSIYVIKNILIIYSLGKPFGVMSGFYNNNDLSGQRNFI